MDGQLNAKVEAAANRAGGLLRSRFGLWGLATISFVEGALLVPIITDPFLVAYILANRTSAVKGVIVTTAASIAGGVAAYLIAVGLFDLLVTPFLDEATIQSMYEFSNQFKEGTFLVSFMGAITPIPYTLVAMAAGFVKASLLLFILASILGRGLRYAIVGWFTYKFGDHALAFVRRQVKLVTIVCFVLLAIYLLIKLL